MASAAAQTTDQTAVFARARRAMIDSQLRVSGINEPYLLDAFARVPREDYVAADQRSIAYVDRQLPLGEGRAISSPLGQARLLLEAAPKQTDKALLIAGGTGYLAALLAPLVASLDVVEPDARLGHFDGERAGNWHASAMIDGWKKGAPYDLIIIDGAIENVPKAIARQLDSHGRIATGTVANGVTRIAIGRRSGDGVALLPVADIGMPVLADFATPKGWSF